RLAHYVRIFSRPNIDVISIHQGVVEAALVDIAVHDNRAAIPGIIDDSADDIKWVRLARFRQDNRISRPRSVKRGEILRDEHIVWLAQKRIKIDARHGSPLLIDIVEPLSIQSDDEDKLVAEIGLMEAHGQGRP